MTDKGSVQFFTRNVWAAQNPNNCILFYPIPAMFANELLRQEQARLNEARKISVVNVNPTNIRPHSDTPEIRKYKKRFNSEILCAALWGKRGRSLTVLNTLIPLSLCLTLHVCVQVWTCWWGQRMASCCSTEVDKEKSTTWSPGGASYRWMCWRGSMCWSPYLVGPTQTLHLHHSYSKLIRSSAIVYILIIKLK